MVANQEMAAVISPHPPQKNQEVLQGESPDAIPLEVLEGKTHVQAAPVTVVLFQAVALYFSGISISMLVLIGCQFLLLYIHVCWGKYVA